MNNFYTYIYLDPRKPGLFEYGEYEFNYEPFYIGKGSGRRWKDKKNDHCEYKINRIKEYGLEPIIKLREDLDEIKAFEIEKELIKLIGKENSNEGPLTNIVDGGEGSSGYKWTEEELQKQRKYFPEIKETFEGEDYTLLTEEKDYKNNETKLEYIHNKCGNKHSIRWNDFQQGHRCSYCFHELIAEKQRKYFPEIKNTFENRDYELLTEEKDYKNCETKLEYIHRKCGNKHLITWGDFKQGKGCPVCGTEKRAKKRRKYFPEIKETIENRDYTLLTKEEDYKNNKQKLECICNKCGNKYFVRWNSFQQGYNCPCRAKKREKCLVP